MLNALENLFTATEHQPVRVREVDAERFGRNLAGLSYHFMKAIARWFQPVNISSST